MIDRDHVLPLARQAQQLEISRGSIYYLSRPAKPSRTYRTRVDPFEASTSELEHLFEIALGQTSRDFFEQLCAKNPDSYTSQQFRTFQRRQKRWRAERADAMLLGSGLPTATAMA